MTRPLRVFVNAVSARTGGGLTYLRELLPPLALEMVTAEAELHVLLNNDTQSRLRETLAVASITTHTPEWASQRSSRRLVSEQLIMPRLLRRLSADVVFHTGDIIPLVSTTPSVLLCRNMLLYSALGKNSARLRGLRQLARLSIRRATAVVFVSQALAEQAVSRYTPERWEVIHHGPGLPIPAPQNRLQTKGASLVSVSSQYDYKRTEIAIEAVALLQQRGHFVTLEVVGRPIETNYVARLRRQVERLLLDDAVRFMGEAAPSQVTDAYGRATVAVVTSANESFCHPILEAFSAQIPVVVPTDLAVAREIAGDAAVYSASSGQSFADAVEALILDPKRYQQTVAAGSERLKRIFLE